MSTWDCDLGWYRPTCGPERLVCSECGAPIEVASCSTPMLRFTCDHFEKRETIPALSLMSYEEFAAKARIADIDRRQNDSD
jgi:hypothetical protein